MRVITQRSMTWCDIRILLDDNRSVRCGLVRTVKACEIGPFQKCIEELNILTLTDLIGGSQTKQHDSSIGFVYAETLPMCFQLILDQEGLQVVSASEPVQGMQFVPDPFGKTVIDQNG